MKAVIDKWIDRGFDIINHLFLSVFALLCAFPLYYIYINAISDPAMVAAGMVNFLPKGLNLQIYAEIFKLKGISTALANSIIRTVAGAAITVLVSAVLGYVFTKNELKHRKFWYRYFILTMYIGAGLIPAYLNMLQLGFLNSFFWIYLGGSFTQAYNMILTKTYMENLPASLEEAAYMDGAGYFKRFVFVILPLSKPIMAAIAVFAAVGQWNAYMDTIIYMPKGGGQTLQTVLYRFLNQAESIANMIKEGMLDHDQMEVLAPESVKYAVTTVVLTPILFVYPLFQKYFTKGLMVGAIKG